MSHTHLHARIQDFISGGGGGGPDPTARKQSGPSFVTSQFAEGIQWCFNRENYTFEGSRGGPTFSREVQLFPQGSKC